MTVVSGPRGENAQVSNSRTPRRPDVTTVELVGGVEELELHDHDERDDPAVEEYLLLSDHLRSDGIDRALYESTRRTLVSERWDDMNAYADARTDVVLATEARRPCQKAGAAQVLAAIPLSRQPVSARNVSAGIASEQPHPGSGGPWVLDAPQWSESKYCRIRVSLSWAGKTATSSRLPTSSALVPVGGAVPKPSSRTPPQRQYPA